MTPREQLYDEWKYDFDAWIKTFMSAPTELVLSYDYSESYEMDRGHIFKLENGKYAVVMECGCSCYDPGNAEINIFENLTDATIKFNELEVEAKK